VHDIIAVQNYKCIQHALQYDGRIFFLIVSPFLDLVEKLFSVEVFEDQVDVVVRLKYLVQLKHVGVPDLAQEIDFVVQTQHRLDVVFEHLLADCLQSKLPLGRRVDNLVDFREVALPDDVAYVVQIS